MFDFARRVLLLVLFTAPLTAQTVLELRGRYFSEEGSDCSTTPYRTKTFIDGYDPDTLDYAFPPFEVVCNGIRVTVAELKFLNLPATVSTNDITGQDARGQTIKLLTPLKVVVSAKITVSIPPDPVDPKYNQRSVEIQFDQANLLGPNCPDFEITYSEEKGQNFDNGPVTFTPPFTPCSLDALVYNSQGGAGMAGAGFNFRVAVRRGWAMQAIEMHAAGTPMYQYGASLSDELADDKPATCKAPDASEAAVARAVRHASLPHASAQAAWAVRAPAGESSVYRYRVLCPGVTDCKLQVTAIATAYKEGADWLAFARTTGPITKGAPFESAVTANASKLKPGVYTATVTVKQDNGQQTTHAVTFTVDPPCNVVLKPSVLFPRQADTLWDLELNGYPSSNITDVKFGKLPKAVIVSTSARKIVLRQSIPAATEPGRYEAMVTEDGKTTSANVYLYVAGLEIADPFPALLEVPSRETVVVVNDPEKLSDAIRYKTAQKRLAVSADGLTQVLLRIPSDQKLTVSLDSGGLGTPGVLRTLSGQEGTSLSGIAPVTDPDPSIGSAVYLIFRAPPDIPKKPGASTFEAVSSTDLGNPDPNDPGTHTVAVSIQTDESITNQSSPRVHRALTLVRPPLVLIHGLWNTNGWANWDLAQTVRDITGTRHVSAANWSEQSTATFDPEQDPHPAAVALAAGISRAVNHYRSSLKIAATQVDAVASSGGGVIARVFSQVGRNYKHAGNYYKGDLHKLITLGSPHTGSLFLVYLWNHRDATVMWYPTTKETIEGLQITELKPTKVTIAGAMASSGRPLDTGIVQDLLPCSTTLAKVTESPVPTHAIAPIRPDGWAGLLPARLLLNLTSKDKSWFHSVDEIFGATRQQKSEFHDLVVEASSATGGLPFDKSTSRDPFHFPAHYQMNTIHSWVPTFGEWWTNTWQDYDAQLEASQRMAKLTMEASPAMWQVIGKLILVPVGEDNVYAPLPKPKAELSETEATGPCVAASAPKSVPRTEAAMQPAAHQTASISDPYIEIVSPKIGDAFAPGDTVTISAALRNGLQPKEVYFAGTQGNPIQLVQDGLDAEWPVPADSVGPNRISVYALGSDGILYSSLTEIFVKPNRPFVKLAAIPESIIFNFVSDAHNVSLLGWYEDGTRVTLTGSRDATYASSDPAVATVSPSGTITAVADGSAVVTITMGKATANVAVTVSATNARPVFQAIAPFQITAGDSRTIPVNVSSPFRHEVTLSATSMPAFAALAGSAATATLVLNPKKGDEGSYQIRLVATDRGAPPLSAVQTVSFTVVAPEAAGAPIVAVTPLTLNFSSVSAGQSRDMTLTVQNTGNAVLNVTAATASNKAFAWVSPSVPFTVAAGAQTTATIRFTAPATAGAQSGTLTIANDDGKQPSVQVALSATVTVPAVPAIQVTPESLDFGTVAVGQSQTLNLTILNKGNATLQVSSATTDSSQFTPLANAFTLAAGLSFPLPIRFTPSAASAQSATLTILSNDPATPGLKIALKGNGQSQSTSDVVLKVDGGIFNAVVGAGGASSVYFVNRLTPPSYPATLKNVQIYFGNRYDGLKQGAPITLFTAADPTGSVLLNSSTLNIQSPVSATVGTLGAFSTFTTSPLTINQGDFVVGFMTPNPSGLYPADQDDVTPSARRSYVSFNGSSFDLAEDLGVGGNFAIRAAVTLGSATTTVPSPASVLVSDSFNRADASACSLGRADLASGGSGTHYYLPISSTTATGIVSGALQNLGLDYGGVQFTSAANCGARGETLPQDLHISVDLLVPASTAGVVQAGPYLRSRAAAPGDGIIGGTSAGYWVVLSSAGDISVRGLNPNAVIASSAAPAGFDATKFHTLVAIVKGYSLTVYLDGARRTFTQSSSTVSTVALPASNGSNDGTVGIAFAAEANRGRAGGQRARNLLVGTPSP